jgi:hypothetical protein
MTHRLRIFALLSLAMLAVAAPAQSTSPADNTGISTVTFDSSWDRATPQKFTITAPSSGIAKYISGSPTKPDDKSAAQDENYQTEFTMSAAVREKIFRLARDAKYFNGDFDFRSHPVASTGKKTLAFADTTRHFQTAFDYSENKSIQELTAIFQGISSTIQHGRRLQYLRRFDKLGLEAELKGMESEVDSHYLAELQIIAPILKSLAEDSAVLNIARQRAKRLLDKTGHE